MNSEQSLNRFSTHKSQGISYFEDYTVSDFENEKFGKTDRNSQNEDTTKYEKSYKSAFKTSLGSNKKYSAFGYSNVKFQAEENKEVEPKASGTSLLNTNMNMYSVIKLPSMNIGKSSSDLTTGEGDSLRTANSEGYLTGKELEDFVSKVNAKRKDFITMVPPKALEETLREARFYSSYRFDSLMSRIETQHFTEEHYEERDDLLYYKLVEYAMPKTRSKSYDPMLREREINVRNSYFLI